MQVDIILNEYGSPRAIAEQATSKILLGPLAAKLWDVSEELVAPYL